MEGIVLRSINNIYSVRDANGTVYSCRIKGKQLEQAKGEYNPIVVGDVVDFTPASDGSTEAAGAKSESGSQNSCISRSTTNS